MKYLNIQETNSTLTALLDEVTATQTEIVITRNGVPIVRIIPCETNQNATGNYPLRGMPITIAEDFDEPMPELWDALGE
ncbi:MAG: type II toxin-antitoxin system Phd/YefM family antitoxin [Acaryochloris sp. SU_5_25]|nr:type II toxin-antitoxin system Phd/YefM family antitoxin [Acaryochloris sp. SU_5_25]